jgi:hypothetical protein
MFRSLLRFGVSTLVGIGARIVPRLKADPRLADAWNTLQAAQSALEARFKAHEDAAAVSREAVAVRNEAYRGLADKVREFALAMLSVVRNNHRADAYLSYFPDGYGDATHAGPEHLSDLALVLTNKLSGEVDSWILSFRDRLTAARDAFVAAQNTCVEAVRAEAEAWSFLDSERRQWVHRVYESRLLAFRACYGEKSYIRQIYAPALPSRRRATLGDPETSETEGAPMTPDISGAPAAPTAPEVPGVTANPQIQPVPPEEPDEQQAA